MATTTFFRPSRRRSTPFWTPTINTCPTIPNPSPNTASAEGSCAAELLRALERAVREPSRAAPQVG
jgi:hypothetical protein